MPSLSKKQSSAAVEKRVLEKERRKLLFQLERWLETPMLVLGFVWLLLVSIELIWGLSPFLSNLTNVIWIVFILDFFLRFTVAPKKGLYLRRNWLTAISLAVPALRVFRVLYVLRLVGPLRALRLLRLIRIVGTLNRGMRALSASMGRRGFGYAVVLTILVTLFGAAGMYAFERNLPDGRGLNDYGTALWWTAMVMTTMGSEYWPQTAEGRILCFLLSLYAFSIFTYVTASMATFFVGQEAANEQGDLPSAQTIEALRVELSALRSQIQARLDQ